MNINTPQISQLSALRTLWQEAFGDSEEFLNTFFATAFSTDRCRCVTVDGKPVAALYWFDCLYETKTIAYIYAVATARAFRGRGICHTLIEDTHRHLASLGYEGVILVPRDQGLFEFYGSMGYQTCCSIKKIIYDGINTEQKLPLSCIDKTEYAALRRQFLPLGSVIQEKENLDFLETQTQFYTGSGFLLAAHVEGDTLWGLELLGDTCCAAAIVNTLGCSKGVFRTPGDDTPFAMYYPLGGSKLPPPAYFGFPFD